MNTLVHATTYFDDGIGLVRAPKMYLARYGKGPFREAGEGGQVKQPFGTALKSVQFVLAEAVAPINPSASKCSFQMRRSVGRCCEELMRDFNFQNL